MTDLGLMYVSRLKHAKGMSLCYNPIYCCPVKLNRA